MATQGNRGQPCLLHVNRNEVDGMPLGLYHLSLTNHAIGHNHAPSNVIRKKREGIQMNDFARQLEISPAYWSRIISARHGKAAQDRLIQSGRDHPISADDAFVEASRLPPTSRDDVWQPGSGCTAGT